MRKPTDAEFWMLFSLAMVLILLYMAFDFSNAVRSTVRTLEWSQCAEVCNEIYLAKTQGTMANLTSLLRNMTP